MTTFKSIKIFFTIRLTRVLLKLVNVLKTDAKTSFFVTSFVRADYGCPTVEQAIREMNYAWPEPDEMQRMMMDDLIDVLAVIAMQGHSGFSIQYLRSTLNILLQGNVLSPLTGNRDEWQQISETKMQNKRCSRVFLNLTTNEAHDIDGKTFREEDGRCYHSQDSCTKVEFPYIPTTKTVEVVNDEPLPISVSDDRSINLTVNFAIDALEEFVRYSCGPDEDGLVNDKSRDHIAKAMTALDHFERFELVDIQSRDGSVLTRGRWPKKAEDEDQVI